MIRFLAKYRHILSGIIIVAFIALFVYLAMKTKDIKMGTYDNKTYSGIAFNTAIKKSIFMNDENKRDELDRTIDVILRDVDNKLSYRNEASELAVFNRSYAVDGEYSFPPDIMMYLEKEMEIYKESNGAFSPCILPLSKLWGIEDGNTEIPSDADIKETLKHINGDDMEITDSGLTLHDGSMGIDFGAVGKGIAADEVLGELSKSDVPGAVISIGGTIATYGSKGADNTWHIGIQDPRAEDGQVFGVLDVTGGKVVSTSGDYEKYFETEDGKRYHHIFDPRTGYPADNGLISVTISTSSGFLSDAMSTACFVMGLEDGMKYAEEKGVDAIFVTSDKKVYLSPGLKKNFSIRNDEYEIAKR